MPIDPEMIYTAKKIFSQKLAENSNQFLEQLFHSLTQNVKYEPSADQAGERSLKNILLGLLTRVDNGESAGKQFSGADNITD